MTAHTTIPIITFYHNRRRKASHVIAKSRFKPYLFTNPALEKILGRKLQPTELTIAKKAQVLYNSRTENQKRRKHTLPYK